MSIKIRSKTPGFRRCGVAHSTGWTEHSDNAFNAQQIAIMANDPMLQVSLDDYGPIVMDIERMQHSSEQKALVAENDALKERIHQLEMKCDGHLDELNVAITDKADLKAEIDRLNAVISAAEAQPEEAKAKKAKD